MPLFKDNTRRKIIGFGVVFYLIVGFYVSLKISRFWGWVVIGIGFADITISNYLMKRWGNGYTRSNLNTIKEFLK
ncbi:MAG: hypothetical protein ACE5J5_05870 [Candidatus Hydrothermarchaeales archaeon]